MPALPRGFGALAEEALAFAGRTVQRLVTTRPNAFPIYTVDGLGTSRRRLDDWTEACSEG